MNSAATLDAVRLDPPTLRFHPAMPSRVHPEAYRGLRTHGPFDATRVSLSDQSILLVYPKVFVNAAKHLADAVGRGIGTFPGFERMFGVTFRPQMIRTLPIDTSPTPLAEEYRDHIEAWSRSEHVDPQLALVLVPHSERWETDRPYYAAKGAFAQLGIPSQMITEELIADARTFGWSVANICLAAFAKLGGIPWVVDAPEGDADLIIGVGRADIIHRDGTTRFFGYAVSFVANGMYRQTWSFTPAADQESYEERLEEALLGALQENRDSDEPAARIIVHLTRRTGRREIRALQRAMRRARMNVPTAFLRLDHSTPYEIADASQPTFAPPRGIVVRLSGSRALLQTEGVTALGVPEGPLLVELDSRSDVGPDDFEDLVSQVYRLSYANWRGFNARSQPVTIAYGELLARLVGYLEESTSWQPGLLRADFQRRPWFL